MLSILYYFTDSLYDWSKNINDATVSLNGNDLLQVITYRNKILDININTSDDLHDSLQPNTPPWVFLTFIKLYKWYKIAQGITYVCIYILKWNKKVALYFFGTQIEFHAPLFF